MYASSRETTVAGSSAVAEVPLSPSSSLEPPPLVIYGHDARHGLDVRPFSIGLDTACARSHKKGETKGGKKGAKREGKKGGKKGAKGMDKGRGMKEGSGQSKMGGDVGELQGEAEEEGAHISERARPQLTAYILDSDGQSYLASVACSEGSNAGVSRVSRMPRVR